MAVQKAPSGTVPPTADVVGNAFVHQYYLVLHQSPEHVHRFYQDVSKLGRPGDDGVMSITSTMQAINEKILSLDYGEFRAEIVTIDAQDSFNGGVFVLVTGYLIGGDDSRRKFTQSFFLAPQDKGYFVLNDIFRYLDDPNDQDASDGMVNDVEAPLAPEPLDEKVAALEEVGQEEVCNPSETVDGSVLENEPPVAEVIDEIPDSMPLAAEDDVKDDDVPKKSYASIVKVMKEGAVIASGSPPVSSKVVSKSPDQQASMPPPAPAAPITESQVSSSKVTENGNVQVGEADGHSIYLKGLPMSATYPQVENEFRRFGAIKNGGIQIRSQKGFCFGFVEFEERSSAQSAIEASPVTIGSRQVVVEPKKSTSRGNSRERFLAGRGAGFRNDGIRGRGNYGGNRGYIRGEANNRGDFGNRMGGRGYQNRGDGYQRADHVGGNGNRVNRGGGFDAAKNISLRVSAAA